MAGGERAESPRRSHRSESRVKRSHGDRHERRCKEVLLDVEELRSKRAEYYARPPETRRHVSADEISRVSERKVKEIDRPHRRASKKDTPRSSRRDSVHECVYAPADTHREGKHSDSRNGKRRESSEVSTRKDSQRAPDELYTSECRRGSSRPSSVLVVEERPILRRSVTTYSYSRPKTKYTDVIPEEPSPQHDLGSSSKPVSHRHRSKRSVSTPIIPTTAATASRSPPVECLTCASSVPSAEAAHLACGHDMCNSCLTHIFTMSTTDPAHMPPKCCTTSHIPLRHVEHLFDDKFKLLWNKKFQEYKTQNRLYCPVPTCGEWIRPERIAPDERYSDRKVGSCKRCKTRVCGSCGGKYHKRRQCPDDEATKRFMAEAKEKGWQTCFNCKAVVELKEGCNHMTCRCKAEFCMLCGTKWKGCDCPWFNHRGVMDGDVLGNWRIPAELLIPRRGGRDPEVTYQMEMDARRAQERSDETLARRMQDADFDFAGRFFRHVASMQIGVEPGRERGARGSDSFGVGNATGHFMNENYVRNASDLVTRVFDAAAGVTSDSRRVQETSGRRSSTASPRAGLVETPPPASQVQSKSPERSQTGTLNAAGLKTLAGGKSKSGEKKKANFTRIVKNGGAAQGAKSDRIKGWLSNIEDE